MGRATSKEPLIAVDLKRMGGVPTFPGTRVPITMLFDSLLAGDSIDTFLADYPSVDRDSVQALLARTDLELAEFAP